MSDLVANSHSDTDDNDSFHSLDQSENILDNLSVSLSESDRDSAADFDSGSENETSREEMIEVPAQLAQGAKNTSKTPLLSAFLKPKSPGFEVDSSDSSACDGVFAGKPPQDAGRFMSPKKFTISPISQQKQSHVPCCPREVPELSSKQMPCNELFNLDHPVTIRKEHLTTSAKTEALQKYAFTEIWIDSQQKSCQTKVSRLREFSMALEAYFDTDCSNNASDANLETDKKDPEPAKTSMAPPKSEKSAEKEYVSPFPDIPIPPPARLETPLLRGVKPPIIVPAGFDLTRLVEYKNPNHWHRRAHMRTGDPIY
ncbi:uncharacterized protein LOC120449896 [Drosophila santomea]|uniref:uncharacterized protein LOC120449896 n=1 Tax=Drosophila santomea TaxID=129105 RepID=UPI0019537C93|nr:uncharacterized protein LOC120449896 [Drosophila santomea]